MFFMEFLEKGKFEAGEWGLDILLIWVGVGLSIIFRYLLEDYIF